MKPFLKPTMRSQAGFTLTEMLIVILLIGVVTTLVAGNVMSKFQRAKVDTTIVQMRNLRTVLDQFNLDCGFYPTSEQGLDALIARPTGGRECKNYDPNGYLRSKKVPDDGWGKPFMYESDGSKYVIKSFGKDQKEGGEDLDKDLSSDEVN